MSYFVYRTHLVPMNIIFAEMVERWYLSTLRKRGTVESKIEINRRIRKRWKKEDLWNEITIVLEVTRKQQWEAMLSESFDQHWLDIKPEGNFIVHGTKNYSNCKCLICLERSGDKIRLQKCNCLFHPDCIETSVRYRKTCPICNNTIYMTPV